MLRLPRLLKADPEADGSSDETCSTSSVTSSTSGLPSLATNSDTSCSSVEQGEEQNLSGFVVDDFDTHDSEDMPGPTEPVHQEIHAQNIMFGMCQPDHLTSEIQLQGALGDEEGGFGHGHDFNTPSLVDTVHQEIHARTFGICQPDDLTSEIRLQGALGDEDEDGQSDVGLGLMSKIGAWFFTHAELAVNQVGSLRRSDSCLCLQLSTWDIPACILLNHPYLPYTGCTECARRAIQLC